MKTISIGKHALRYASRGAPITYTNCSQAVATHDASGYRVIGFDRDGRRWSVSIDERLIDDLAAMRARNSA